jgi:putative ABC transport system substrate-binding protein
MLHMSRREFITLLGGAAAAWPFAAGAQQADRVRRIGALMSTAPDDPVGQADNAAFLQGLAQLGWIDGRNVRIDTRWPVAANADDYRKYAAELVALAPDVLLAAAAPGVRALQQVTRTVPIVFANVVDPVGAGFVDSLARPGGNVTGFTQFEYGMSAKWLELLKEIAPGVKQAAVLRDPTNPSGTAQFAAIQAVAPSLAVEVSPVGLRDAPEIERAVTAFARSANRGLIVTSGRALNHRELIIKLAAQHRLPAVYPYRFYVTSGGLICYGPDLVNQLRSAAGYVDRILKGEKPADLPVQGTTKSELIINLKTAKALGLEIPPTLLARADEVIE